MITRVRLLSQSLASANTVAKLAGYKYQPLDVAGVLAEASGLVEAVAGWGRAARRGTYVVSEQAPLGAVWTLPIYPVHSLVECKRDGENVTSLVVLENDRQLRFESWDVERLHDVPPKLEATIDAGYAEDEAPFPVLLAVAVAADMILAQTAVGPRELSVPGLSVKLPSVARAIQEVLGVA